LKAVWEETVDRTGGAPTAAAIRNVRRDRERRTAPPPHPVPPAPAPVVPPEVHRIFLVVTQATQEALALGGPAAFTGLQAPPQVLAMWAGEFDGAARVCADLAQACRDAR
jgi:hypothetical protein